MSAGDILGTRNITILRTYLPGPVAQPRASSGRDLRMPWLRHAPCWQNFPATPQDRRRPRLRMRKLLALCIWALANANASRAAERPRPSGQGAGLPRAGSSRPSVRDLAHFGICLAMMVESAESVRTDTWACTREAQAPEGGLRSAIVRRRRRATKVALSRRQSGCCRCAHTTPISCTCRAHAGVPDDRHWLHASDCGSAWSHASSPSVAELATGGPSLVRFCQPPAALWIKSRGGLPLRPRLPPSQPRCSIATSLADSPCPGDTPWLGLQVAHHAGPPSCRWPSRA